MGCYRNLDFFMSSTAQRFPPSWSWEAQTCCVWLNHSNRAGLFPPAHTHRERLWGPHQDKNCATAAGASHQHQMDPRPSKANPQFLFLGKLQGEWVRKVREPCNRVKMRFGPVKGKIPVMAFFFWNNSFLFFLEYATEISCIQFSLWYFLNKL